MNIQDNIDTLPDSNECDCDDDNNCGCSYPNNIKDFTAAEPLEKDNKLWPNLKAKS